MRSSLFDRQYSLLGYTDSIRKASVLSKRMVGAVVFWACGDAACQAAFGVLSVPSGSGVYSKV